MNIPLPDDQGLNLREFIMSLYAPLWTPEFEALHQRIHDAKVGGTLTDDQLALCADPECIVCGAIVCPHKEPLHFHHDGCPACDGGVHG